METEQYIHVNVSVPRGYEGHASEIKAAVMKAAGDAVSKFVTEAEKEEKS